MPVCGTTGGVQYYGGGGGMGASGMGAGGMGADGMGAYRNGMVAGGGMGGGAGMMAGGSYGGGAGSTTKIAGTGVGGECGGACCGAGALCCEAEGAVVSTNWAFVGPGNGAFTTTPTYNYVGEGCGSFDKQEIVTYHLGGLRMECLGLILLVPLLLLGLWYFKPNTATTTPFPPINNTTPSPDVAPGASGTDVAPGAPGICIVWGDPHIMTFDHKRADFYTPGEYWIVKSATVFIQGRYQPTHATSGLSVMKEIAIGGPFMQNHRLIIGAIAATFNGMPILQGFPSSFNNQLVQATYNSEGEVLQKGRGGMPLHIVHLTLPLGVSLQINRWTEAAEGNYINAKIMMSAQPGQDGHCGNFNGNAMDDDRVQIRARVGRTGVAQQDLIFPGQKTPVVQGNRPDINDCPAGMLDPAKDACKKKEKKFIPSMACLIDVCFGGKGFAEEDGDEEH